MRDNIAFCISFLGPEDFIEVRKRHFARHVRGFPFLSTVCGNFLNDFLWRFVLPQTFVDGVAHSTIRRPFRKLHFAYVFWLHPGDRHVKWYFAVLWFVESGF